MLEPSVGMDESSIYKGRGRAHLCSQRTKTYLVKEDESETTDIRRTERGCSSKRCRLVFVEAEKERTRSLEGA